MHLHHTIVKRAIWSVLATRAGLEHKFVHCYQGIHASTEHCMPVYVSSPSSHKPHLTNPVHSSRASHASLALCATTRDFLFHDTQHPCACADTGDRRLSFPTCLLLCSIDSYGEHSAYYVPLTVAIATTTIAVHCLRQTHRCFDALAVRKQWNWVWYSKKCLHLLVAAVHFVMVSAWASAHVVLLCAILSEPSDSDFLPSNIVFWPSFPCCPQCQETYMTSRHARSCTPVICCASNLALRNEVVFKHFPPDCVK